MNLLFVALRMHERAITAKEEKQQIRKRHVTSAIMLFIYSNSCNVIDVEHAIHTYIVVFVWSSKYFHRYLFVFSFKHRIHIL